MIVVYIILATIILIVLFFFIAVNNFRNPIVKNDKTPINEGIEYETYLIPTNNNRNLNSWWIRNESSDTTIILMHGWGKNSSRLMSYIKNLNKYNFNILAFDSRNHGNSDKDGYSSMVKFAEDIKSCINFIKMEKPDFSKKVYLVGLSIGGAASIYAAANDNRINKIVTIGAPSNPADVMRLFLIKKKIPKPVIALVFKYLEFKVGKKFNEISAANNINKTQAKTLLIHGTYDRVVPVEQGKLILGKANENSVELWKIKGKGHSNCHYERGFWDKLVIFFNS